MRAASKSNSTSTSGNANDESRLAPHDYHDHSNYTMHSFLMTQLENVKQEASSDDRLAENGNKEQAKRNWRCPRGGVTIPFPTILHIVLSKAEQEGFEHIISWQPHGRCFLVRDPKKFVEQIMPIYFCQTKFTSFQRQLNLYGFSRLTSGKDRGSYYHELFLKHKLFLCQSIRRTRIKGMGVKGKSNPETEPDFYSMSAVKPDTDFSEKSANVHEETIVREETKRCAADGTEETEIMSPERSSKQHANKIEGFIISNSLKREWLAERAMVYSSPKASKITFAHPVSVTPETRRGIVEAKFSPTTTPSPYESNAHKRITTNPSSYASPFHQCSPVIQNNQQERDNFPPHMPFDWRVPTPPMEKQPHRQETARMKKLEKRAFYAPMHGVKREESSSYRHETSYALGTPAPPTRSNSTLSLPHLISSLHSSGDVFADDLSHSSSVPEDKIHHIEPLDINVNVDWEQLGDLNLGEEFSFLDMM